MVPDALEKLGTARDSRRAGQPADRSGAGPSARR